MSLDMRQIRIVFFDLNGTLTDPEQAREQAFAETLKGFTGRWAANDGDQIRRSYRLYRSSLRSLARQRGSKGSADPRLDCLRTALQDFPLPGTEAFLQGFLEKIRQAEPDFIQLAPGAEEVLDRLKQRYELGIISNGSRGRQDDLIRKLKLERWFHRKRIFTASRPAMRKPSRSIFLHALRKSGISPSEALMVGDSRLRDVRGALKMGMAAIWLKPGNTRSASGSGKTRGKGRSLQAGSFHELAGLLLPD